MRIVQGMATASVASDDVVGVYDRKKQRSKKFKDEDYKRVCNLTLEQLVGVFALAPSALGPHCWNFDAAAVDLLTQVCVVLLQNNEYVKIGEAAWDRSWEILHDQDGWKLHKGSDLDTGTVHSKKFENEGNCFKLQVKHLDPSHHILFTVHDLYMMYVFRVT